MEAERPAFRYFFEVVLLRFRNVLLSRLPRVLDEDDYLDRLGEALSIPLPYKEKALVLRKKAEIHLKRHEIEDAEDCLGLASRLEPHLPGLAALKRRVENAL